MKNILVYILLLMVVLIPLPSVLFYLESQKLLDHSLAVTLLVVEVPVGLSFIAIERWLHKSENKVTTTQRVITETSFDKQKDREEYVTHLRNDILGVIEAEIKNQQEGNYAGIIRSTEKNKRMILQHLFTYEKGGITQPVYSRYKQIHSIGNKIDRIGFPISEMFNKLTLAMIRLSNREKFGKISSSKYFDKVHETLVELDYDKLPTFIGFPENIDFLSDSFSLDLITPILESEVNNTNFYVHKEDFRERYYVKYNDKIIVKCNSKKYADDALEILLEHYSEIVKFVSNRKYEKNTNENINKIAFDKMFTHIRESIKQGKPDFGVCYGCMGFFPYGKKIEYQKLLAEFNYSPINWAEEIWE